ncbi:TRAP transporter large permease, partial [Chloroflexota bacterium]
MDPLLVGSLGIIVLLVLLVFGVHISVALGVVGLFGCVLIVGWDSSMWLATSVAYHLVAHVTFIILPLFIFMGVLGGASGISRNIYMGLKAWVGRVRGGLGITTIGSCAAFGVVTGSSLVTSAVFAKVSAPEMRLQGYGKSMAYGICASGGSIGMLIPPSGLMVIYGLLAEESIGKLLIGGIAPGILLAVLFSIGILIISYIKPSSVAVGSVPPRATWRDRVTSIKLLWPVLVLGTIIIGGILGGVFSPTEAAAFGAFIVLVITLTTTGSERWKILSSGMLDTISVTGMLFLIIIGAGLFARFLMLSQITPRLLDIIIGAGLSNLTFVIVMAVIYLAMGCFLDSIAMLSITLPLIIPIVRIMGIDGIWFAIVSVVAIEVGLITPPLGLNV